MSSARARLVAVNGGDEPFLWVGLWTLLRLADPEGVVLSVPLAAQFRARIVELLGMMDGSEADRMRGIERMPAADVAHYLQENLLLRLSDAGLVREVSSGVDPGVRFAEEFWGELRPEREEVLEDLARRAWISAGVSESGDSCPWLPVHAGGSLLRAEGLVKAFRGRRVVDEVSVRVRQGEIVGLLGPNGAGKTTTFYMMVGLLAADAGRVFLDEREVTRVPMYRRARDGIGYLSQEPSLFRKLTVEQNVMAILETLGLDRKTRERRLEELLDELSLGHLRGSMAYALSGGEQRRLEITRALVAEPKFMLLDEPFAGVDPIAVDDIQRIIGDLKRRGLGVLITDHNARETLSITDRAYLMFDGRIRIEGAASELVRNPEARKLYLGLDFRL